VDKTPLYVDSPPQDSVGVADFSINALMLENNLDPLTGAPVSDHIEIVLSNSGKQNISNFILLYNLTDSKTGQMQSYLVHLGNFVLGAGQNRSVHIDLKGTLNGTDGHYRANPNGLYYTSPNDLKVDVTVDARGHRAQKVEEIKAAGGAEVAD
jgi:hypothetical protein